MLAKRREAEQMKIERTTAVNSYFKNNQVLTTKYKYFKSTISNL